MLETCLYVVGNNLLFDRASLDEQILSAPPTISRFAIIFDARRSTATYCLVHLVNCCVTVFWEVQRSENCFDCAQLSTLLGFPPNFVGKIQHFHEMICNRYALATEADRWGHGALWFALSFLLLAEGLGKRRGACGGICMCGGLDNGSSGRAIGMSGRRFSRHDSGIVGTAVSYSGSCSGNSTGIATGIATGIGTGFGGTGIGIASSGGLLLCLFLLAQSFVFCCILSPLQVPRSFESSAWKPLLLKDIVSLILTGTMLTSQYTSGN